MNMRTRDRTTGTEQSRLHSASDLIKEFILSHQLQTGSPLPSEARLCEALGISRSSLREGIKRLEALDIVEVQHGNGTFVGKMSLSPLVEALSFRAGVVAKHNRLRLPEMVQTRYYLELGLAETVCARLDGTEQAGLEALVEEMLEKAEHDEDFSRNDFAFHDGILALVDNDVTRQVISSFGQFTALLHFIYQQ
ncbi:GntR family transcriptional regulator [Arcanobacterium hippocoleae]